MTKPILLDIFASDTHKIKDGLPCSLVKSNITIAFQIIIAGRR